MYFAQTVLIPLALAILLSFLIAPLVNWLSGALHQASAVGFDRGDRGVQRNRGHRLDRRNATYDLAKNVDQYEGNVLIQAGKYAPAHALWEKWKQAADVVQQRMDAPAPPATTQSTQPVMSPVPHHKVETFNQGLKESTGVRKTPIDPASRRVDGRTSVASAAGGVQASLVEVLAASGLLLSPLGTAGIVVVFVISILLQREDLAIAHLTDGPGANHRRDSAQHASTRISRYLTAQAFINGTYGIAISLGLWIIGLTLGG